MTPEVGKTYQVTTGPGPSVPFHVVDIRGGRVYSDEGGSILLARVHSVLEERRRPGGPVFVFSEATADL